MRKYTNSENHSVVPASQMAAVQAALKKMGKRSMAELSWNERQALLSALDNTNRKP